MLLLTSEVFGLSEYADTHIRAMLYGVITYR